ncbi:MAG: hemolysin III family protein [Balneolaceae bacterium]
MYKGERFNSITHLIGSIASAIGLTYLVYLAVQEGDPWKIASFTIYGTTLLALYTFSTLYHSLKGRLKHIFQKLDHVAIYLLMGWLIVIIIEPLIDAISLNGFTWLAAGGLCYSLGIIFYGLDYKYRLAHGIWHLFVLAGSFTHFVTIAIYV